MAHRLAVSVLGATGSIGTQALDVIRKHPERFRVAALTASANAEALYSLVREFRPQYAGLCGDFSPRDLPEDVRFCEWGFGARALTEAARLETAHSVLVSVVGVAGLRAVLAALEHGKRVLLANKEALVAGGELVMRLANGDNLLPVDSEHAAIHQCLAGARGNVPRRLVLTASGGPFRVWDQARIDAATVREALAHPVWNMGPKITVDCASLMNKGLEVIEAHWLFGMPPDRIDVLVHPQSVVHSMVEYEDGCLLAQLGAPDMRAPIAYALGYPDRLSAADPLTLERLSTLTFELPDTRRFPLLALAYDALRAGGCMPAMLNAANEVAVRGFLEGRYALGALVRIVAGAMERATNSRVQTLEDVLEADRQARALASDLAAKCM